MGAKESWDHVGEQWRDLGQQLHARYRSERQAWSGAPATPARPLSDQVGDAFRSLKQLAQDPEITGRLDRAVRATGEAISTTVDEAAEELRQYFPKRDGPAT
jgi:hypothetical protein